MGEAMSSLLFQPPPPSRLRQSKLVFLETSLGERLPAFHISVPGAEYTFLYSHANAEDLGNVYPWCKFLAKMLKVNLFAYDYSGYGLSSGSPSEQNCYADITGAYNHLTQTKKIHPSKIILYGRSLGTGPSCYLSARLSQTGIQLGGLILHAPFCSIYRIVMESGCTLLGDRFPNIDYAPMIKCPVLLIHGKRDKIVPYKHSEQLYEAFGSKYRTQPLFIKEMGHNHVSAQLRVLFLRRVKKFIEQCVSAEGCNIVEEILDLSGKEVDYRTGMVRSDRERCPSLTDTLSSFSDDCGRELSDSSHRTEPFCISNCDVCDISRVFSAEDEEDKRLERKFRRSIVANSMDSVDCDEPPFSSRSRIRLKKFDNLKNPKSLFFKS